MKITTDSFMRIGKGHTVCEDYVIHGEKPFPYVILADGCSSSKNTDVGARILTHITKEFISNTLTPITTVIHIAENIRNLLGLEQTCLDSTLIVAVEEKGKIWVSFFGDGAIIQVFNDGKILIDEIKYTNSAPYYLSYQLDKQRNASYKNMGIMKYVNDIECHPYNCEIFTEKTINLKTVLITTDGISSFLSNEKGILPSKDVVNQLSAFKNTNGAFIQRRCNRMIKDFEKEGYYHLDDFSVGGFYFK